MIIRRWIFWAKCFECGASFEIVTGAALDKCVLLSKKTLQPAIIDYMEDPVFDEVWDMVKKQLLPKGLGEVEAVHYFDLIFCEICDPAPDGSNYNMTDDIPCPNCHCPKMHYGPTTDPEIHRDVEFLTATHHRWDKLIQSEKKSLVVKLLDEVFFGKHPQP